MSFAAIPRRPRPGSRAVRHLAQAALVVWIAWGPVASLAAPPVRSPAGALATEYWDLVARLDSGQLLIAQTVLSNLGSTERSAGALGWLIAPDGSAERFKRSEAPGAWLLTDGGRRIDLHSVALEPAGPKRRFEVGKDDLGIDLAFEGPAAPVSSGAVSEKCPFEVLEPAAAATVRLRGAVTDAPVERQARVALTHRWTAGLEADCVARRVEVFVLEPEIGMYFSETLAPDGSLHRWLVAKRAGRVVFRGDPGASVLRWNETDEGFGTPLSLHFGAAGLDARVRFDTELASVDPTERLPRPMQWLVAARMRPRLSWLRAPFEISLDTPGGVRRSFAGEAVAKVTYMNPLPGGRLPSRVAVQAKE